VKQESQEHLERAQELLRAARDILDLGYHADSVGRSYYAIFHAATAVLPELGVERGSHHGVWAAFGQFVTARGLLDVRFHRVGIELFDARSRSEYRGKPADTKEDAEGDLLAAGQFVAACRALLEKQ